MFDQIFFHSFILTFFSSVFFIVINLSLSNNIFKILKKNKILVKFNYNFLLCFYLIFLVDCIFFNIFVLFNFKTLVFYSYFLFKLLFFFNSFSLNDIKKFTFFLKNFIKKEINIHVILIIFLIFIAFLPVSDADSIHIHLNFPISYLYSDITNLGKYAELSLFHNSEIILFNALIFKSSNIGSILNITSLIIFFLSSWNNKFFKKNFLLFFFSTPLILFLLNTQKLQVFFSLLYLTIFIYFYEKNTFKNKKEIFLVLLLFIFYLSGKISYYLISIPLFIFILFKVKFITVFKNCLISFFLVIFPILLIKFNYYSNPFAPFLANLFNSQTELINLENIINLQGWKNNSFHFYELLSYIIPYDLNKFSSAVGLGFLYLLCKIDFKNLKSYYYVSIGGILLIYVSGQISPRFYFESILLLMFFFREKISNFFKPFFIVQYFLVFLSILAFSVISFKDLLNLNIFLKKNANSFNEAQIINKLNIKKNESIIILDEGRDSIFYNNNIFPIAIKDNPAYLIDTIYKNNIKYLVFKDNKKIPSCLGVQYIDSIKFKNASRNFFNKKRIVIKKIFLIKQNNCRKK